MGTLLQAKVVLKQDVKLPLPGNQSRYYFADLICVREEVLNDIS